MATAKKTKKTTTKTAAKKPATKNAEGTKPETIPPQKKQAIRMRKLEASMERRWKQIKLKWKETPEVVKALEALGEACEALGDAAAAFEAIPDDYVFRKTRTKRKGLEEGEVVRVREKFLDQYVEHDLKKADLLKLTVKRVGKKVKVTTAAGEALLIPRGELQPIEAAA